MPTRLPRVGKLLARRRSHLGVASSAGSARPRRCSTSAPQHDIVSDIELIPIQKINEAYERMLKSDVKYRFVIDMASLREK